MILPNRYAARRGGSTGLGKDCCGSRYCQENGVARRLEPHRRARPARYPVRPQALEARGRALLRFLCLVRVILQPQSVADLIKESFFRWKHRSLLVITYKALSVYNVHSDYIGKYTQGCVLCTRYSACVRQVPGISSEAREGRL